MCSSFNPCAAALLNISPDHLEWHKSQEHYCASKFKLFEDAPATRTLILREQELQDYPKLAQSLAHSHAAICVLLKENTQTSKAAVQESSSSDYAYVQEQDLFLECSGEKCRLSSAANLKIKGRHNLENCLMASYLAYSCGLSIEEIREAITSFTALEHRIEFVAQIDSCSFYNDSKATNIDAATQALGAFDDKPLIILLGGHDKGADLSAFAARVLARCKAAICFGEASELFYAALSKAQPEQLQSKTCKLIKASNLKEAFDLSLKELAAGDCVVLSPACSSYDEFNNYQERGRFFKSLVLENVQKGGE